MAEIPGVQLDKQNTYHKEVILKKEGKTWIEYYAILVGKTLIFNRKDNHTGQIIPHNLTIIEINNKTQCGFEENKTCYRFPFWLQNGKAKYRFKCETKLHRHKWMFAIRLCSSGKPPEPLPKMIPTKSTSTKPASRSNSSRPQSSSKNLSVRQKSVKSVATSTATKSTIPKVTITEPTVSKIITQTPDSNIKRSNSMQYSTDEVENNTAKNKSKTRSRSFAEIPNQNNENKNPTSKIAEGKIKNKLMKWDKKWMSKTSNNATKTADKNNGELKGSVLENQHVRDSMSDVREKNVDTNCILSDNSLKTPDCKNNLSNSRPTSLNIPSYPRTQASILSPSMDDNDRTPTNEMFRCISCEESFSKAFAGAKLLMAPPICKNDNHKEFEIDGKGQKYEVVEIVDVDSSCRMKNPLPDTGGTGKTPVENDELDSYPSDLKYHLDGHIETFGNPSRRTPPVTAFDTPGRTITYDRFGRKISDSPIQNGSGKSNTEERAFPKPKQLRKVVAIESTVTAERTQSCTSLQPKKNRVTPEPSKRRENSAPILRFSRHAVDSTDT